MDSPSPPRSPAPRSPRHGALGGRRSAARLADLGHLLLWTLSTSIPIAIYNFILIERMYNVLLGRGAFLRQFRLNYLEAGLFVLLLPLEVIVIVFTASVLLRRLLRLVLGPRGWTTGWAVAGAASAYFLVVTADFEVFRYFKDGLDFVIVRGLGGGSWREAVNYVQEELLGLLPLLLVAVAFLVTGAWTIRRYGEAVARWLEPRRILRPLASRRGLLLTNAFLLILPPLLLFTLPALHYALAHLRAYQVYQAPVNYLSDVDGDGYGLLRLPADQAPFDPSIHPYAFEKLANGIDENGVGGDLPRVSWTRQVSPWDASKLEARNVLLIVLESARHDILDAEVEGRPVMPYLRSLPGHRLQLVSHVAFTTPSVTAILNGTLSVEEAGLPLIDRFKEMGYRTGVFSGQHEGFGDKAALAHMHHADRFVDASTEPEELRMYPAKSPASLKIPAPVVNARFAEWLESSDPHRPFFAYLNWQELHFPYHYRGAPAIIATAPLARSEIGPETRHRLHRTYLNGAWCVDLATREVMEELDRLGLAQDTVVLITGDHGEELFDTGYLGHGIDLNPIQNAAVAKIVNSPWVPPPGPIGLSDVTILIHNALVRRPEDALPLTAEVFCYVGQVQRPRQIGTMSGEGMVCYDFVKDQFTLIPRPGEPRQPLGPQPGLIHLWESYVLAATVQNR